MPFSGVASEMIGAGLAGWDFCQGVELNESDDGSDYIAIAKARLDHWLGNPITTIAKDNGETVTAEQRVQFEDENALRARMAQGGHDGSQERA